MDNSTVSLEQVRKLDERVFAELLKNNCILLCINHNRNKKKKISINALYNNDREFWLNDSSNWSYFACSQMVKSIIYKLKEIDLELEKRLTIKEALIEERIDREYAKLIKIKPEERLSALTRAFKQINRVIHSRAASAADKNKALIEVSSYSYLVNKVTLDEVVKMTDEDARKASVKVARITEEIISSLTDALKKDVKEYNFMHSLVEKSNGVTLRHMVRTFVLSYRFVLYFNDQLTRNGLASRLRANFETKYRSWYSSLIPHIPGEDLTLENVFKGGMRPVPEKDIKMYSAGFLLHDIGKQRYIDYYEGGDDFDSRKVESHAKTGYRMLLQKSVYSEQIAAIAGYHHEYYGHESGYGYYRELCALMKLDNRNFRQDSCISYDLEDLHQFNTLSFLPVKFLEIVDVFDAITDPGRSYKSHMDTFEALKFMREEFVISNKKIDLILFELFVSFVQDNSISI
jgi:HD domain